MSSSATPWTVAHQSPLFFTVSWNLLKFMVTESVMLSISSSVAPFPFRYIPGRWWQSDTVASQWTSAAAAKSHQSCPTLWDPIDGSPPGSPIPGILQARTLEWVAISFSNAWKWKVKVKLFSCVRLFTTPQTTAYQAPPPMGFSRQEYCSGVPLPSPLTEH